MDGDMLYWLIEYGKVLLGYGFLMFLWPLTLFRKYLKKKSVTFKFSFCVTAQIVIVSTVMLLLGLLHILNDWTVRILFYGSFLYSIRHCFAMTKERKTKIKYLVHGSYGFKNFVYLERRKYMRKLEEAGKRLSGFYKKHWLEYSLLIIAVVYGVIYFSWGTFQERSYGFSDMYVHHSWIYQLSEGIPFSAGIYPEGMHCVIYAISALFGCRIYSCILFIASANVVILLLAIYCFVKELFAWRFSAVLVLWVVLTFGDVGRNIILCFARIQCALPQEFAFPQVFLCALFLLKYLKAGRKAKWKGKVTGGYWDGNLLIFMMALSSTIMLHFYATFMAFFLCVGVALVLWKNVFTKERFLPLVAAVAVGVFVAAVPMVAGYATGIPLQGSLGWAMEVMQNSAGQEATTQPEQNAGNEGALSEGTDIGQTQGEEFVQTETPEQEGSALEVLLGKINSISHRIWEKGKEICNTIYERTYCLLYDAQIVPVILWIMAGIMILGILGSAVLVCLEKLVRKKVKRPAYRGYFITIFASLVYIFAFTSDYIGLPMLVDRSRICFICHVLVVMLVLIPADFLFGVVKYVVPEKVLNGMSGVLAGVLVAVIYLKGCYHGYLYFEVTRYDASVQVTNRIIEELPRETYTIVSPTDELYQVIEYGWHEELVDFLEKQNDLLYEIPTEYIFLFLEKKPLRYAQHHFFSGPKWLAYDRYQELYDTTSTWPEYIAFETSAEAALEPLWYFSKRSGSYADGESRTIIQSKLEVWCQKFKQLYSNEMKVFYEDEYFVCYYFKQNPQRVYNLVIK
ncbi:MAG: hypothetical protein IKL28_03895 [Lachnospiraceae bacterium]|nr:hypothetical protein [Lachnospiraceae bacterium]